MKKFALAALIAPALLAACGGGSSGSAPAPTRAETFATMHAAAQALGDTTTAQMPVTGRATYEGVALFGGSVDAATLSRTHELSADVTLDANFAAGSLEGSFTAFEGATAEADDKLTLSNGQIINGTLIADVAGQLKGEQTTGDLAGTFHGDEAQRVTGTVSGLTLPGGSLQGAFVAAK